MRVLFLEAGVEVFGRSREGIFDGDFEGCCLGICLRAILQASVRQTFQE